MKLKEYIKKENLVLPNYDNLNIVDLVKFLYDSCGIECDKNNNINKLKDIVPIKKHIVFILVDGMGSNLINILSNDSILKKNKILDMITVSPSSTGCVLTSLATATYPTEHGIIGWYNYNRKHDIDYYPLLFTDRKNNNDLRNFGIEINDIFKVDSKLNQLKVKTSVLYPDYIYDSVYSNYVANNKIRKSYATMEDAFDQIIEITTTNERTFTYLYLPSVDNLEHDNGFDSKEVLEEINKIETQIKRINNKDVITIVTADHGQTNINEDIVMNFDKYDKYFYAYPGIDFGMATYYVKKDMEKEFLEEFNKDFEDKMYLFKTEEFIKNNVFGPYESNQNLLDNLGEYISLCNSNAQFINSPEIEEYYKKTKGNHSGLTNDEMIIPLIIINN